MKITKKLTPPQKIKLLCRQRNSYVGLCRNCRKSVEMVSFREAVQIVGRELDEVIECAAGGSLHLGVRPEALLICLDSLLQADFRNVKNIPSRSNN